jgi:very-short-patch-repair endonuclease
MLPEVPSGSMSPATDHMLRRARSLRRSLTVSEQRLWKWLRKRTFGGYKFRRQVPIGRYVVDFYCHELKLVIEVDGQHHGEEWMTGYDSDRTRFLASRKLHVLRLTNELLAKDSLMAEETRRRRDSAESG